MLHFIRNLANGIVIGIAEIIPGVSGGTLAVLLNIYDQLIGSISHLKKEFKKSIQFLVPVVLGMGVGIFAFSHLIKFLLANYPMAVNFLFIGLIIGIVPMLFNRSTSGGIKPVSVVCCLITLAIMAVLAVVSARQGESSQVVTSLDFPGMLKYAGVGMLAAVCMILPGISGSMMMVIFGTYDSVVNAVSSLNILFLLPVGVGIVLGLLFGAKAVDICLHKWPQATYAAILGLVIGSLASVYMKSGFAFGTAQSWVAILLLIVGAVVSYFFTHYEPGKKEKDSEKM